LKYELYIMKRKYIYIFLFSVFSFITIILNSCYYQNPVPIPTYQFLNDPIDLIIDKQGTVYITNFYDYNILSLTQSGVVQPFVNVSMQNNCSGDGGLCFYAQLSGPEGITIDNSGNIYFLDGFCRKVHKIDVSTHIMTLIAGNGSRVFSGDGGLAINAGLGSTSNNYFQGITIDNKGNLYISIGNRIRKVNLSTGIITTFAGNGIAGNTGEGVPATVAEFNGPCYLAADDTGNIYITDAGNFIIRKVSITTNIITTIAGKYETGYNGDNIPATAAYLSGPAGIKIDTGGNIYFCDNTRIREIKTKTNFIYTVAGDSISGYSGDGGPATAAELEASAGLAIDPSGNLYFICGGIRKITMSTGIISTVLHY
jgi:hypothetical protein